MTILQRAVSQYYENVREGGARRHVRGAPVDLKQLYGQLSKFIATLCLIAITNEPSELYNEILSRLDLLYLHIQYEICVAC